MSIFRKIAWHVFANQVLKLSTKPRVKNSKAFQISLKIMLSIVETRHIMYASYLTNGM